MYCELGTRASHVGGYERVDWVWKKPPYENIFSQCGRCRLWRTQKYGQNSEVWDLGKPQLLCFTSEKRPRIELRYSAGHGEERRQYLCICEIFSFDKANMPCPTVQYYSALAVRHIRFFMGLEWGRASQCCVASHASYCRHGPFMNTWTSYLGPHEAKRTQFYVTCESLFYLVKYDTEIIHKYPCFDALMLLWQHDMAAL